MNLTATKDVYEESIFTLSVEVQCLEDLEWAVKNGYTNFIDGDGKRITQKEARNLLT
jgi:hypothetical protein